MNDDKALYPPVDPIKAGLGGRCPRCGEGRMFSGMLSLPKHCAVCDLDYSFADSGDGPAIFVILIVGGIVVALAAWLESLGAPFWLHFVLWPPIITVLSIIALRWMKGVLVAQQYATSAAEGRLDKGK